VVAYALVDVVPRIAADDTHERPWKFSVINQKGLFQQNRHFSDVPNLPTKVGYQG
jgi:hypothetical protein